VLVSLALLVTIQTARWRRLAHPVLSTPTAVTEQGLVLPVLRVSSLLELAIPFAAAVGLVKCRKMARVSVAPVVAMPGLVLPTVRSVELDRIQTAVDNQFVPHARLARRCPRVEPMHFHLASLVSQEPLLLPQDRVLVSRVRLVTLAIVHHRRLALLAQ